MNHLGKVLKSVAFIALVFMVVGCHHVEDEEFTIHYESSYGTVPQDKIVESGYLLTTEDLPTLTNEDYIFTGWDKEVGFEVVENLTITANWKDSKGGYIFNITLDTAEEDVKLKCKSADYSILQNNEVLPNYEKKPVEIVDGKISSIKNENNVLKNGNTELRINFYYDSERNFYSGYSRIFITIKSDEVTTTDYTVSKNTLYYPEGLKGGLWGAPIGGAGYNQDNIYFTLVGTKLVLMGQGEMFRRTLNENDFINIGEEFNEMEELATITDCLIDERITSIAKGTFYGASKLKKVIGGKGINSIGEKAFYNCTELTEISIYNKNVVLGSNCFGMPGGYKGTVNFAGTQAEWNSLLAKYPDCGFSSTTTVNFIN